MADTENGHPLKPTRPSVPEHAQPRSTESHPGHVEGVDDFEHDATVAHEHSDVNVRAIAAFVIGLFVVGFVIYLALWFLMGFYSPSGTLPPEPRLLTNEPAALQQLRTEEDAQLKAIDQAKREAVGTLPSREGGEAPGESPARAAGRMDTSSGRRQ
jgi:hypothetical protein